MCLSFFWLGAAIVFYYHHSVKFGFSLITWILHDLGEFWDKIQPWDRNKGRLFRKKWLEISNMNYKNEKLSWLLQGLDHAWMLYLMMIDAWGGKVAVFREDGGG